MSDQGAHVPTEQETTLYDALTAGNHETIDGLAQAAVEADPTPPDPVPEGWLPPVEQYARDHFYARAHYQADHEAPQQAREVATKAHVIDENTDAPEQAADELDVAPPEPEAPAA